MVSISRQCPFGADKAVQISQAVTFDKGTQPELSRTKNKIAFLIRIFFMSGSFRFKLSENCNIAVCSMHTQQDHTGKCIRGFAGIYAYCRYFID